MVSTTNTAITSVGLTPPPPITHVRYVSSSSPQFQNCFELSKSGDSRRLLAGEYATVSYTGTANVPSMIDVASGAIILVRRIKDRRQVWFELDVPMPAPHWDGERTDNLADVPSAMPARSTPARRGIS